MLLPFGDATVAIVATRGTGMRGLPFVDRPRHPPGDGMITKTMAARDTRKSSLGRILVVEDDAVLALSIEAALQDAGAREVEICKSTDGALEALRRSKPDAIVLDVQLADRDDGWAIAELVDSVGPKPPRIVFSTGAPERIPEEIAGLGDVLAKPYDPQDLVRLLGTPARKGLFAKLRGAGA